VKDFDPKIVALRDEIAAANEKHRSFLDASIARLSDDERGGLSEYINFCLDDDLDITALAKGYGVILQDTLREQLHFMRLKSYRYASFADVADSVYYDDAYMRYYMHGLALTAFIWPNHLDMHRFFVKTLPREQSGAYLEIGPGHGANFLAALRLSAYDRFTGIDISPTSVDLTRRLIGRAAPDRQDDVMLLQEDFLRWKPAGAPFDAIVMGEVLEHVEDPAAFLAQISELSGSDTYIHVTTCINAPAIDHIYLFRHSDEIEDMIAAVGLYVRDRYLGPHHGTTVEKCIKHDLPINIAYVLGKEP